MQKYLLGRGRYIIDLLFMKATFFILGFFLLYLSSLPCGDSKECNAKTPVEISANDNHQQHNHESEACTPFCTCSCCPASSYFYSPSKTHVSKVIFQSGKHPLFNVAFNSEAHYAIWQPPQLS